MHQVLANRLEPTETSHGAYPYISAVQSCTGCGTTVQGRTNKALFRAGPTKHCARARRFGREVWYAHQTLGQCVLWHALCMPWLCILPRPSSISALLSGIGRC